MGQVKVSELPEMTTVPSGDELLYIVSSGISKQISVDTLNLASPIFPCDGRLTLTSGTPISDTDESGTTVYFTPYKGNRVASWDGARWVTRKFSEISLDMSGQTANTNYDIFLLNIGTPVLESVPWASNTSRNVQIEYRDGILVYSADHRYRYLGTVRLNASGNIVVRRSTGSGPINMFLWNYYNQVPLFLWAIYPGSPYTYTSSTYRKAANNDSTTINAVCGDGRISTLHLAGYINSWNISVSQRVARLGLNGSLLNHYNLTNLGSVAVYGHVISTVTRASYGLNSVSLYEYSDAIGTSNWSGGVTIMGIYM